MYGAVEILRKMLRILWKETKINAEVKAIRKRQKKFIGVFNGRDGIEKLASCRHIRAEQQRKMEKDICWHCKQLQLDNK